MVTRGIVLFLGAFGLLNSLLGLFRFDANIWWIDAWMLSPALAQLVVFLGSSALVVSAIAPPQRSRGRVVIALMLMPILVLVLLNVITYYVALSRGAIRTPVVIPLSALILILLSLVFFRVWHPKQSAHQRRWLIPLSCAISAAIFPLLQIAFFGNTNYARPADVAVVFGARAYADGRPSNALEDRVLTACRLYQRGLVSKLILSGGPGDGQISEPQVMRSVAIAAGVPESALILDDRGLSTRSTVRNVAAMVRSRRARVIAVSDFYHLPRTKLAFQQAGIEVYTVPAEERGPPHRLAHMLLRECIAWWAYQLHGA